MTTGMYDSGCGTHEARLAADGEDTPIPGENRSTLLNEDELVLAMHVCTYYPTDHRIRTLRCLHLMALQVLRDRTGILTNLEEQIEIATELVDAGHLYRGLFYSHLTRLLKIKFQRTGDLSALDTLIACERDALRLRPSGHPARAATCWSLGNSLHDRFTRVGGIALLDESIRLHREALKLRPISNSKRSQSCSSLAGTLGTLFEHTGTSSTLDEAISLEQEALTLRLSRHPKRHVSCMNLAALFLKRHQLTGRDDLLEVAISLQREALTLQPAGHPCRAGLFSNLASALIAKFRISRQPSLLDEAVALHRRALGSRPVGHPDRASGCDNLASALVTQFEQGGQISILDEAIRLQGEALSLRPSGHPWRPVSLTNLATALRARSLRTGDDTLDTGIIKLDREALTLRPLGHPDRAISCTNLAISINRRSWRTGDQSLHTEVISLQREALELEPAGHPHHATSCGNLAHSLLVQFHYMKDHSLLTEAIHLGKEALGLQPKDHYRWPILCHNLAGSLEALFSQIRDATLLQEACDLREEAIDWTPEEYPGRWRGLLPLAHLHLNPLFSGRNVAKALHYMGQAVTTNADNLPLLLEGLTNILLEIGGDILSDELKQSLLQVYTAAVDLAALVTGSVLSYATQLRYLATCRKLGSDAYILANDVGESNLALKLIERSRGIIFSQTLRMQDLQIQNISSPLFSELKALLYQLHAGKSIDKVAVGEEGFTIRLLTQWDNRHQQYNRVQHLLREIRILPGMADFMRGPSDEALMLAADTHPVIVLVAGDKACYALMITSPHDPPINVKLKALTPAWLERWTDSTNVAHKRRKESTTISDQNGCMRSGIKWPISTLRTKLAELWRAVVKPIFTALCISKSQGSPRPRLHWCPTGAFASVPLHAAGIYDGPNQESCSEYVISSYTPTLTALLRAQNGAESLTVDKLNVLLIAADRTEDAQLPPLPSVGEEVKSVIQACTRANIDIDTRCLSETTSSSQVSKALESSRFVHIACHGVQHPSEPLYSAFCLRKERLRVEELMELDLKNAFLAFLSACETAKGDKNQPDQTIHLAATMLFAGFRSVVATMWAMNDQDGPFIAKHFYEELFKHAIIDVDRIPYALDYAIQALRKTGAPPERWATFIHMGA